MTSDIFTVVSVDVISLRFDHELRLGLDLRGNEPFAGSFALPGVVVRSGERIAAAAVRACGKLATGAPIALGQLRTFDEPLRDPRGPSLSVAMWAVLPDLGLHSVPIGGVPPLAFDHAAILEQCWPILADKLWKDQGFTRALLGGTFTTRDALTVTRALTRSEPHRGNLNRTLDQMPGIERVGTASEGGRPGVVRRFSE